MRMYGKMASMKRKQYEASLRARVALEVVKGEKAIATQVTK